MSALPATASDLLADLIRPGEKVHPAPTPANPANPAKTRASIGLAHDSGTCEGLRISAKAAPDSQTFAGFRRPQNDPQAVHPCGSSQLSQDSQGCRPAGAFVPAWGDADIARFLDRRDRLMRWGWKEPEAEALADRLVRRDLEADTRVTCADCRHYKPGACGNHKAAGLCRPDVGRDLAVMLQRCPGHEPHEGMA